MINTSIRLSIFLAGMALFAVPALAEKADRDKPVNLEADRITVDEAKQTQVFEGNVVLTQGTLTIRTDRMVVSQDSNGYQKGTATGGPDGLARFRQKREGRSDYVEGEAERIDHDAKTEKSEFRVRAYVKSGQDEVRGPFIAFDSKSETYVVSGTPGVAPGKPQERVRAVIQPRKEADKPGT